jgi:transposase
MYLRITLSHSDAVSAVELFEQGFTAKPVALSLGLAASPVQKLYQRWQTGGSGALVTSIHWRDGEDGLLPKRRGRPLTGQSDSPPKSGIETSRLENARLSIEVTDWGKWA